MARSRQQIPYRAAAERRYRASWAIPILLAVGLAAAPARAEIEPPPPDLDDLPLHGSSRAELESARGLPVARLTIAGNRRISAEALAEHLSLRPDKVFTPEALARDVRELWDSGIVEDVEVDLGTTPAGVSLRFLVRERPSVKSIEFRDNDAIDADDLREVVSELLKPGDVLSHGNVRRAADKIRDKYAEEGYYLAEVESEVTPAKGGQSIVRFRVREHEKVSVRRINFVGNQGIRSEELSDVMLTGKGGFWQSLGLGGVGGPFRQDAFERDIMILNALYYDRGYLAVRIGTPRVMLTPDREGIEVSIPIEEGPRYRVRTLTIEERDADGQSIEPLGGRRHLREMIHARSGDYFNRAELVRDISAVQTMYRDAGYANVEVPPATELDPETQQVDIRIAIQRSQPVRFGRVEIRGNTKTRDKVIRRELEIREEGLFNETGLDRSRRRIQALGFFERVDISTAQGIDPNHLDVNIDVSEKPTGTFQVGAGFSSMESFLFTAQIQQQNLFGTGRSLTLNAQLSGLRQLVDFRLFEPHLADTNVSLSVNAFDQLRAYEQFSQASKGGSITLGYPLKAPHLFGALTYTLQHDRVEEGAGSAALGTSGAVSAYPHLPLANLFAAGLTSSLRPSITYDTRNNQLFPTSGMFLQTSLEAASSWLGSANETLRFRGTARFYQPLTTDESVVLRFNAEAGLAVSPSKQGVPLFQRFFLGGILDVRGFPLRSLGPRLPLRSSLDPSSSPIPDGANVGGNLMYYQNLELEFPILKAINLRGVVFTDLGNVWNTERQYCRAAPSARGGAAVDPCFSLDHLLSVRASWGFGIRWLSPMGPLRFEWGIPFKPMPYEKKMLFEFTIGSAF
ncbi:Outer membrane protein assembly factor YaeT precursor [Minicystis rosea]|nr:Outer membrane protein assembly factor YaeT precursor [Minicystis rosea]